MVIYINKRGNTVLALHRTELHFTVIGNVRGTRKLYQIPAKEFQKDFKMTADSPRHLAEVWLNSPLSITPEGKRRLQMAPESATEVEVKAVKGKKAKKEKVVVEKAVKTTSRSIIREFLADKAEFTIDQIVELVGGSKANASTTITLLIKPEKAGKEGPIPFQYDKTAKVYRRV